METDAHGLRDDRRRYGAEVRARLRILGTTDLHVHLLPWDYYADRPLAATGLAVAASVVRRLRAEALAPDGSAGPGACLLFDNGDFLQGNLLSDWLAREGWAETPVHPMIAAMNALGYDGGTLGNHEFNYGLPYLEAALAQARFPIVSANVVAMERGQDLVPPWTILTRDIGGPDAPLPPLRIGAIGFAPPQLALWDRLGLGGRVGTRDILEAAREAVPRLRAAGAEIVVALCHSGIGPEAAEPMMENAAVPLAAVPGIDVILAGHTHAVFPNAAMRASIAVDPVAGTLHGKPAVQAGFYGSHVGIVDLDLLLGPAGWRIAGHSVRVESVARAVQSQPGSSLADPVVAEIALPSHRLLLEAARRPIGRTEVALFSHFSMVAQDDALAVVADAQRAHAHVLLAGTPEADVPILVAVAPFKAGGQGGPEHYIDIPPGPLALRQAAELYLHINSFCLIEITGAGLASWLERSASLFARLVPGLLDQPLHDPTFASYNFDLIDGLTYTIDPTLPARTDAGGAPLGAGVPRVLDIRHEGRAVADDDRFVLATNSYRLGSGGGFEAALAARPILMSPTTTRDIILAHVRGGPLRPAQREGWRFASSPGTGAWFDTGPGAMAHLGALQGRDVRPLGPGHGGFARFALHL